MRLLFFLTTLIFFTTLNGWMLNPRFALGPAWHSFFSQQLFAQAPNSVQTASSIESITTNAQFMPYFEGQISAYSPRHFNLKALAGIAQFKQGSGIINQTSDSSNPFFSILKPAQIAARTNAHILISDVSIGSHWYISRCAMLINPLLGYTYNKQLLGLLTSDSLIKYELNNIWKGPYIGIEATWEMHHNLQLTLAYKCIFAHVHSTQSTTILGKTLNDFVVFVVDPLYASRSAPALGNYAEAALWYAKDNWRIGSTIKYFQYKNHKPGNVCLGKENANYIFIGPESSIISGASLNRIMWKQISWTIGFEGCFS